MFIIPKKFIFIGVTLILKQINRFFYISIVFDFPTCPTLWISILQSLVTKGDVKVQCILFLGIDNIIFNYPILLYEILKNFLHFQRISFSNLKELNFL